MAKVRFVVNPRGVQDIMRSEGIGDDLRERADRVVAQARTLAPIDTGAYRNSIKPFVEMHPTRQVAHILSGIFYADIVEAKHRVLGRAIDAARG
jgi:hypothetical protein